MDLLEQEEIIIESARGEPITYVISKLPATLAREVITQYPLSALPKLGDYERNEELMLKLMRYVGIAGKGKEGAPLMFITRGLIDNHVPDFETLARLEMAMLEKNCGFFRNGGASNFLKGLADKVQNLLMSTLTSSLQQLSKKD
jgi:hypothetical protein